MPLRIVDAGTGPPIVIVPGIQGRWEWIRPAVEHLARECRVITFSLADEPTSGARFDPARGFAGFVQQVADAMDAAGLARAVICGVSFGGLIAAAFAARHPERVAGLVFVSALPPTWQPDARIQRYVGAPLLYLPLFAIGSLRMFHEIRTAAGSLGGALRSAASYLATVIAHPYSARRMARRVTLWQQYDLPQTALALDMPALVITGEPHLDRVVPAALTREYLTHCSRAESAVLSRTGHIGLVTRPGAFARLVAPFVARHAGHEGRRLIG